MIALIIIFILFYFTSQWTGWATQPMYLSGPYIILIYIIKIEWYCFLLIWLNVDASVDVLMFLVCMCVSECVNVWMCDDFDVIDLTKSCIFFCM